MLLHKEWGNHLRTGNWLFKYAGMIGLAERYNTSIALPDHFIWKYLQHPPEIDKGIPVDIELKSPTWEPCSEFWDLHADDIRNKNVNISLDTFLQSEDNWKDSIQKVIDSMAFREEYVSRAYKWFVTESEKNNIPWHHMYYKKDVVGISIRRGDFVGHGCFKQIDPFWYISAATTYFDINKTIFIIFSDDIEWCKQVFTFPMQLFAPANNTHLTDKENYHRDPMEQLIIGAEICNAFIVSNSTFSWWMAYLATAHGGTVIRPNGYFDGEYKKIYDDSRYYPDHWIIHE